MSTYILRTDCSEGFLRTSFVGPFADFAEAREFVTEHYDQVARGVELWVRATTQLVGIQLFDTDRDIWSPQDFLGRQELERAIGPRDLNVRDSP